MVEHAIKRLPDDISEVVKYGTKEQKAELLCLITEMAGIDCNRCLASDYCSQGHTGYLELFEDED